MSEDEKWTYIRKISALSYYGYELIRMMDFYNKDSLYEITAEEAKSFWEHEIKDKE